MEETDTWQPDTSQRYRYLPYKNLGFMLQKAGHDVAITGDGTVSFKLAKAIFGRNSHDQSSKEDPLGLLALLTDTPAYGEALTKAFGYKDFSQLVDKALYSKAAEIYLSLGALEPEF